MSRGWRRILNDEQFARQRVGAAVDVTTHALRSDSPPRLAAVRGSNQVGGPTYMWSDHGPFRHVVLRARLSACLEGNQGPHKVWNSTAINSFSVLAADQLFRLCRPVLMR